MKTKTKRKYLTILVIVIAIVFASSNGYAIGVDTMIGEGSANMVIPTSTLLTDSNPLIHVTGDRSYNYGGPSRDHKPTIRPKIDKNYPTPKSTPKIDKNYPTPVIPPISISTTNNGTIVQVAGFRSSDYGGPSDGNTYGHGQTDPVYWVSVAQKMSAKFPGSSPGAIWVVGYIETPETSTFMPFPAPSGYKGMHDVTFSNKNGIEETMLTAFDKAGMKVILQVEPGDADVSQLATMILNKYKNHSSVVGFGVDTEWLNAWKYKDGRPATDIEIQSWLKVVRAVNPNYKLVVKHWLPSHLGSGHIAGVTYVTDTLSLGSYKNAIKEYVAWANYYNGSEIGYQIGYQEDMNWWLPMSDPTKSIMTDIKTKVPSANIYSVYFVDFAITKEFPTK